MRSSRLQEIDREIKELIEVIKLKQGFGLSADEYIGQLSELLNEHMKLCKYLDELTE